MPSHCDQRSALTGAGIDYGTAGSEDEPAAYLLCNRIRQRIEVHSYSSVLTSYGTPPVERSGGGCDETHNLAALNHLVAASGGGRAPPQCVDLSPLLVGRPFGTIRLPRAAWTRRRSDVACVGETAAAPRGLPSSCRDVANSAIPRAYTTHPTRPAGASADRAYVQNAAG